MIKDQIYGDVPRPDKITTLKFSCRFKRDVHNFKYLDIKINSANNSLKEIKIKKTAMSKCNYVLSSVFISKGVSLKSNIALYKIVIDIDYNVCVRDTAENRRKRIYK